MQYALCILLYAPPVEGGGREAGVGALCIMNDVSCSTHDALVVGGRLAGSIMQYTVCIMHGATPAEGTERDVSCGARCAIGMMFPPPAEVGGRDESCIALSALCMMLPPAEGGMHDALPRGGRYAKCSPPRRAVCMMLPPAEGGMRYAPPRGGRRAGSGGHATRTRGHASEMGGFSPPSSV